MQLIKRGNAAGDGFSGGSVYTGLAGIALACLHLYESTADSMATMPPNLPRPFPPQARQTLAAEQESLLNTAAEMAELARAHQEVK